MSVKDRIAKINEYFLGMDVKDGIISVAARLPEGWRILDSLEEKFGIAVESCSNIDGSAHESVKNAFYFAANLEDGFDVVFDAIEFNINTMKAEEERLKIRTDKINELYNIFDDESNTLEMLRTLSFVFSNHGASKSNERKNTKQFQKKDEIKDNADNEANDVVFRDSGSELDYNPLEEAE